MPIWLYREVAGTDGTWQEENRMRPETLLDGRLKLRHLVLLVAIAEHGGVVKAAEHLHVTQPVVTRGIRELEAILGVDLFERGPRGMTATVFGTAFVDHARAILGEVRRAGRHIAELADGEVGTVTVGTHLAGSNVLLPRAIARLKAQRPGATVVVREATPDLLLAELLTGAIDMTVGRLTPVERSRARQHALYREPIRLVTRKGHPATGLDSPSLDDLLHYPWIVPVAQTALRQELEAVLVRYGLPLPADRIECTSILTMRTLLLDTDVIAVLPLLVARDEDRLAILPTALDTERTVGVTIAEGGALTPTARLLLEHLEASAREIRQELE